jgi:abhydrolase domain-containing protein 13
MILENTFTSLPALVPHVLPALSSFSWLCHQKWNSGEAVAGGKIAPSVNVLLLSGLKDEIVPAHHMKTLKDLFEKRIGAAGEEKKTGTVVWREFENGMHSMCLIPLLPCMCVRES